jgi:hypothetical protein
LNKIIEITETTLKGDVTEMGFFPFYCRNYFSLSIVEINHKTDFSLSIVEINHKT